MRYWLEPIWHRGPLWRQTDFLRMWSAQTISQFGTQVTNLALPFVAIVLLESTPFEVAALTVVEFLPWVLFSLPAGVFADRVRQRPILVAADWGRALILASIPLSYFAGVLTLWQLYVVGFGAGTLTVVFDVSYQSYLPSLVVREHLGAANARLEMSSSAAQLGGPGLSGLLVGTLTAPYAILLDVASFVTSALVVSSIRRTETIEPAIRSEGRMWLQVTSGLRFILGHPILRATIVCAAAMNFCANLFYAVLLVYAVRRLHLSAQTVGIILSLGSVGSLVGALSSAGLARIFGLGRTLAGVAAVGGWALLLVPAAARSVAIPFLIIALFVFGFYVSVYRVISISLYQAITPNHLLGRMNGSRRLLVWGMIPLGALAGGGLASVTGVHATLWIGAVGAALAFLPLGASTVRNIRTEDDAALLLEGFVKGFLPPNWPEPT